jgi:hypothetical protein
MTLVLLVAIPGLLRSRIGAGEASPIGTLKTFTAGQEQFRSQGCVDEDMDGVGEYGLLAELAGFADFRGTQVSCANSPFIPTVFKPDVTGKATKSGCHFIIYLVGKGKSFCTMRDATEEGADRREDDFVAYAWPVEYGKSGNRIFALNSEGQIMQNPNSDGLWSGENIPPPGLAYKDGRDTAKGSGKFVQGGDKGGATEPWAPIG